MKKTSAIILIALVAFACSRKTVASSDSTSENKTDKSTDAPVALVKQGHAVYTAKCGKCHGLKPVENFTADRWNNILKKMIPKAKLTDAEAEQVTAYVMANAKK
jgi:mono/diheme cytochrome c family protein